jgi:hypothetical protein
MARRDIARMRVPAMAGVIALWLCAQSSVRAQTGGFVVTLGRDTVQVERFVRRADRLDGVVVTHAPQTRVVTYTLRFAADGSPSHYEFMTARPDGTALRGNGQAGSIEFASDTLTRETLRDGAMVSERVPARPGILPGPTVPYVGATILMYELGFAFARPTADASGASGLPQVYMIPGFTQPSRTPIWFIGTDSVEMDYFGVARRGFKLDAAGRVIRSDWTGSTYKYKMVRVGDIDVDGIAESWGLADKKGAAMGAMSPLDTVRANVGTAAITIAYSRPAKRGRVVWGSLVPWGSVWRFGADFATHITTTQDLMFGTTMVPAGRYTLWMLPSEQGESMLIVNKQVNIFGTAYKPAGDLARIPLQRTTLRAPVERFTLAVEQGRLWVRWDISAWSVPVVAK